MKSPKEPKWLDLQFLLVLHDMQLAEHGGAAGVRDIALLESALGAARNAFAYEQAELFTLAAIYASAICNNHPFIDGNKRTAFMAAYTFLGLNGEELDATEESAALMTLGLADKSVTREQYAKWLKENCREVGDE